MKIATKRIDARTTAEGDRREGGHGDGRHASPAHTLRLIGAASVPLPPPIKILVRLDDGRTLEISNHLITEAHYWKLDEAQRDRFQWHGGAGMCYMITDRILPGPN